MRHIVFMFSGLWCLVNGALNAADFGTAGYGNHTPDEWYTVETFSYPEISPLSLNRDLGTRQGRVYLSPTGITIGEAGNYEVNITAILFNPEEESVLTPVFLAIDDEFDPENSNTIGGVGIVEAGELHSIHGHGFLLNLEEGARLSLVVTNGGYPCRAHFKWLVGVLV